MTRAESSTRDGVIKLTTAEESANEGGLIDRTQPSAKSIPSNIAK